MPFTYSADKIREIVKARKRFSGPGLSFQKIGEHGRKAVAILELVDGPLVNLRLYITSPILTKPETYTAALVLDDERIRGVDFSEIQRRRLYKETKPKGWHENIINPNQPTHHKDRNRHESLRNFEATDLQDFVQKIGKLWQIEMAKEKVLL
jgi:hypothetical protein